MIGRRKSSGESSGTIFSGRKALRGRPGSLFSCHVQFNAVLSPLVSDCAGESRLGVVGMLYEMHSRSLSTNVFKFNIKLPDEDTSIGIELAEESVGRVLTGICICPIKFITVQKSFSFVNFQVAICLHLPI